MLEFELDHAMEGLRGVCACEICCVVAVSDVCMIRVGCVSELEMEGKVAPQEDVSLV